VIAGTKQSNAPIGAIVAIGAALLAALAAALFAASRRRT